MLPIRKQEKLLHKKEHWLPSRRHHVLTTLHYDSFVCVSLREKQGGLPIIWDVITYVNKFRIAGWDAQELILRSLLNALKVPIGTNFTSWNWHSTLVFTQLESRFGAPAPTYSFLHRASNTTSSPELPQLLKYAQEELENSLIHCSWRTHLTFIRLYTDIVVIKG